MSALFQVPLHHSDRIDRILVATALVEDIPIISGDRISKQYRA